MQESGNMNQMEVRRKEWCGLWCTPGHGSYLKEGKLFGSGWLWPCRNRAQQYHITCVSYLFFFQRQFSVWTFWNFSMSLWLINIGKYNALLFKILAIQTKCICGQRVTSVLSFAVSVIGLCSFWCLLTSTDSSGWPWLLSGARGGVSLSANYWTRRARGLCPGVGDSMLWQGERCPPSVSWGNFTGPGWTGLVKCFLHALKS